MADEGTAAEQPADALNDNDDLRNALEASFDTLENEDETPAEEAAPPEKEGEDAAESAGEDESTSQEDEPAPDEASGSEAEEDEQAESEDDDEPAIEPPQHWAEEHKETFRNLPAEAQNFVLDRHKQMEADYTRKTQEIADVRNAVRPAREALNIPEGQEGRYVGSLVNADMYLRQSPNEAIQQIAQAYGIDLGQFGRGNLDEDEDEKDPYVAQLEEKVQNLERQFTERTQNEQQANAAQLDQQIQAFADEKDDKGDYKHPHFAEVRAHMGGLMQAGAAQTLEDAYDQAVWARPDLRQDLIQQQTREAAQREAQRRKEKAAKAKQAATPASAGSAPETEEVPDDLGEDLRRNFDRLST